MSEAEFPQLVRHVNVIITPRILIKKYTAEKGGKIPVTKVKYDESVAPKQLAYVMDVFKNAKGTFGFYNESMPTTETGAHFDDTMVSVFLGDLKPADAAKDMESGQKPLYM